jgi:hypothetical protein
VTKEDANETKSDVVLLGPPTKDGAGVHVLRARDERIEAGELRALEHGRPISGEVVTLAPRKANPRICDVKESLTPPRPTGAVGARPKKGPAQVATKAYRDHWEETFARFAAGPPSDADLN